MIITTEKPFTLEEMELIKEQYAVYIKTVIDLKKKICVAGMYLHAEGKKLLLEHGSDQSDIWGGGVDLETEEVDFNSFINIRPDDHNTKNEIQSDTIRKQYKELTEYFFQEIL